MATAVFLQIIDISSSSLRSVYQVTLEYDQDIRDAILAVREQSPLEETTIGAGSGQVINLTRTNITMSKTSQCDWIRGYVDYSIPTQSGQDTGPTGGKWPEGVTETIQLSISSNQVTSHNIYITGGTVTDVGTFSAASAGYSQEGFPLDVPIVTLNVRKRYATLPSGWAATAASKVGKVNSVALFGAPIGSLKYKGLATSDFPEDGSATETELTHIYQYAAPVSTFTVNGMTIPGKKGWEIYDFKSKPGDKGRVTIGWQILKPFTEVDITP